MRSSKDRKHIKVRKRKALSATRTDASRARRLDNKAKRDEIHAINPDAKITIVDGITYMNGVKVKVINGQIKSHLNTKPLLNEPIDVFEPEPEIVVAADEGEVNVMKSNGKVNETLDDQVEKVRLGIFNNLADRFKKK